MAIEIGNILFLSNKDLISYGIPKNTAKDFGGIRNPSNPKEFIYEYDKVYNRSPLTKAKIPSKAKILALIAADKAEKEQLNTLDNTKKLVDKFSNYYKISDLHYFSKKGYSDEKAKALATSMSVLRFLDAARVPKKELKEATGFEKREELIKAVAELMKHETRQEGHQMILVRKGLELPEIPTSYDRLRAKVDRFSSMSVDKRVNVCEILMPKKNNCNAQIIGKPKGDGTDCFIDGTNININDFHASTIIKLTMNPGKKNKLDFVQIHARYSRECDRLGKEAASLSAVKAFLGKECVKDIFRWERNGFADFDKILAHVHGKSPEYSLRKGGIDGFQVDFYTEDKKGYVMLTAIPVFDYKSEAITGLDVSHTETGLIVRNAYRNHLRLHGGRTYFELDMDASMANKAERTKEMFDKVVSRVHTSMSDDPTGKHRANSKSRISERLIEEFNRLTQNMEEWKGTNITSYFIHRKPNPDFAVKYMPTVQDGIQQIVKLVNIYNNEKLDKFGGKSRMEVFNASMDPEAEIIDPMLQAQLFNWSTTKAIVGDLLAITVNTVKYEYFIDNPLEWAPKMGIGRRVKVYYDEDDMKQVYVFGWEIDEQGNPIESFLGVLQQGERSYRDQRSQTEKDIQLQEIQMGKRKKMISQVLRKQYEVEAYNYGIDPSVYPNLKDLEKVIMGARSKFEMESLDERFSEALATPEAERTTNFYKEHFAQKGIKFEEKPTVVGDMKQKAALLREKFNNKFK